jgi:hypothetical protein
MTEYAWLQKHPTPAAQGGEFHWYPEDGDRELRAVFAERLAAARGGEVLWQLAPGRVAWAQTFVATSPLDGRRYVGLALAIGDALDHLALHPARPFTESAAPGNAHPPPLPDAAAVARALLSGGDAAVGDPSHPGLPRAIAGIERAMPRSATARVRTGSWLAGTAVRPRDRVAELAVDVALAKAWRLACELSVERSIDDVIADAERERSDWVVTLNAWGRGKVALSVDELADRVALRALARLLSDRDPHGAIAEARWYALIPEAARAELLAAVARRAATLRRMIDG